jgi:hypothetical protein
MTAPANTSFVLFYSFLFLLIAACAATKTPDKNQDFPGTPDDSLVAYIERTRCFGVCPVYSIRVYRSGYVLYEGIDNVQPAGRHYLVLTHEQLRAIGEKAVSIGYFELKDEYRNPYLTDFPTVYTEVRFRGKRKKITHYDAEPPPNLVEMEKYLDSLFPPGTPWIPHQDRNIKD